MLPYLLFTYLYFRHHWSNVALFSLLMHHHRSTRWYPFEIARIVTVLCCMPSKQAYVEFSCNLGPQNPALLTSERARMYKGGEGGGGGVRK